jgi:hypothetical protein
MRRGVRFLIPDVVTDVEQHEVEALLGELFEMGWPTGRRPDILALHSTVLEHQTGLDQPRRTFQPDDQERALLLRATDHLRNLGHHGELLLLRDRLIASGEVRWIDYRLRFLDGSSPVEFTSYSLRYAPGDRIATPSGTTGYVLAVEAGEPEVLVVGDWRDLAQSLAPNNAGQ